MIQAQAQITQTPLATWLSAITVIMVAGIGLVNTLALRSSTQASRDANSSALDAKQAAQDQGKKLTEIHTLVNNDHGVTLRLAANALRRVADLTHDPGDVSAANDALNASNEHDAKQKIVDAARAKEANQ